jgi:prefoldin subunit 5
MSDTTTTEGLRKEQELETLREEVRRLREKLDEAEHRVLMVEHLKDQLRSASVALENFWAAYESGW